MTVSQKFALESKLEKEFAGSYDSYEEFKEDIEKYVSQLNEAIESGTLGGSFKLYTDESPRRTRACRGAYIVYNGTWQDVVDFAVREDEFLNGYGMISREEVISHVKEAAYPIG